MASATAKSLKCPSCGSAVTLRALGQTMAVHCQSCKSLLDVSTPEIRVIAKYDEFAMLLRIPLGTRGVIRGLELEVIGALGRSQDAWSWEEYLLYSPYVGFRWLVWDHGNWSFVETPADSPKETLTAAITYRDEEYKLFNRGKVMVDWVMGEFYWRVEVGDEITSNDYIAPPHMLCREKDGKEISWSLMTWLPPGEVAKAFGVAVTAPAEVAPHQPNPLQAAYRAVRPIWIVALLLVLVVQGATMLLTKSHVQDLGAYNFASPVAGGQLFGPIYFPSDWTLREFQASGGVNNSWVELDCQLVNEATGRAYSFASAYEYYSGYDSDGSWSEGSTSDSKLLTSIPAGTYSLLVNGERGGENAAAGSVHMRFATAVVPWRNFFIALLVVLAIPLRFKFLIAAFERQRWSTSDFSPFGADDSDDDDEDA